jgi:hypothetical protein
MYSFEVLLPQCLSPSHFSILETTNTNTIKHISPKVTLIIKHQNQLVEWAKVHFPYRHCTSIYRAMACMSSCKITSLPRSLCTTFIKSTKGIPILSPKRHAMYVFNGYLHFPSTRVCSKLHLGDVLRIDLQQNVDTQLRSCRRSCTPSPGLLNL